MMYYFQQIWDEKSRAPNDGSVPTLWDLGLGNVHHRFAEVGKIKNPWVCAVHDYRRQWLWHYHHCRVMLSRVATIMLCASPQLAVSALDVALNNHLTRMIQLRDWRRLGDSKQHLRVSNPEPGSQQTSTYWLSLPYRYSLPQMISSTLFSWLISSTLIISRYQWYDDNGNPERWWIKSFLGEDRQGYTYRIHYSGLAILSSLIVSVIMLAVSIGIGLQRCPTGPPSRPSNSFLVAAACHPPENDRNAGRKLVQWGVVPSETDTRGMVRHCTITSGKVESLVAGAQYA